MQPNNNLFTIKQQFDPYYNSILASGDSELLDEGGDYAEYKKYMNFWVPRLAPSGDFTRYFDAQKTYYSSSHPFVNTDPWHEIGPMQTPAQMHNNWGLEWNRSNRGNIF